MTGAAVTLAVLAYNHERFVEQCLDSVATQTLDDFETIVIDDCSNDRTVERIERWLEKTAFPAQLLVNDRNRGVCATANRALRHGRGQFISMISADDYYESDRLGHLYQYAQQLDPSTAAVFGNSRTIDEQGREVELAFPSGAPPTEGHIFDRLISGNFLAAPTVMARREAMLEVGGYDEDLFYEDYDMWLKLADRYEFRFLPDVVVNCRIIESSLSHRPENAAALHESRARLLLKWYGKSPHTDTVILRRAWRNGLRALVADPVRGRRVLESVRATRPTLIRRVGVAASAAPGADKALAGSLAVADKLRSAVRDVRASNR